MKCRRCGEYGRDLRLLDVAVVSLCEDCAGDYERTHETLMFSSAIERARVRYEVELAALRGGHGSRKQAHECGRAVTDRREEAVKWLDGWLAVKPVR